MLLEKWYADVVEGASLQVFYRARLQLGPMTVGYAGQLNTDGRAHSSFIAGEVTLPSVCGGDVAWPGVHRSPDLRWTGAAGLEHRLWEQGAHVLDWNPLVLNGHVTGAGYSPSARGYAERLRINFGPWQLGLDRLKWGRFCGRRHSFVWIEWVGQHPKRLALFDGMPLQLTHADSELVRADHVQLCLGAKQVLVSEPMDQGALSGLQLPRRLSGLRFLRGVETKLFSPGELRLAGHVIDEGHAVFEEVVWP